MLWEKQILNKLLDSYEGSKLSRGENQISVHIAYVFQKKSIPEYFDESSTAYEEIHAVVRQLQERGFIRVEWKNNKPNHIIHRLILCEDMIPEVYTYLKRIPKANREVTTLDILKQMQKEGLASLTESFVVRMIQRIQEGKTVREYLMLEDTKETKALIHALNRTEQNTEECFIREFSIRIFHDSKRYEMLIPKICRIFREENDDYENQENDEILSEYQIYHTPSYVYLKGDVRLERSGQSVDVNVFEEGFGFAVNNQNLFDLQVTADHEIKEVYTIENLTTFFRFRKENSLIIYLGGYHNHVRRALLEKIYEAFPIAAYYHFGDIDAGGFQIYYHLREKTGIPFQTYCMDLRTLQQYESFGKKLTDHDVTRLQKLMNTKMGAEEKECAEYMVEHRVKLEQECI